MYYTVVGGKINRIKNFSVNSFGKYNNTEKKSTEQYLKCSTFYKEEIWLYLYMHVMGRMNTEILGTSELKWTRMDKFNSDDHYFYYCGQESLRRNGVAIIGNIRVQNAVLGCNLKKKKNRMISVRFQGKSFNITVIQVYAPTTDAES